MPSEFSILFNYQNGNKDEANSDGFENSTSEVNNNQGEKEESS